MILMSIVAATCSALGVFWLSTVDMHLGLMVNDVGNILISAVWILMTGLLISSLLMMRGRFIMEPKAVVTLVLLIVINTLPLCLGLILGYGKFHSSTRLLTGEIFRVI